MRKIQDAVEDIVYADEEGLYALAQNYMNLSAYAKRIRKDVEKAATKDVQPAGIVVALSRMRKNLGKVHPLVQHIAIKNITSKSPLSEIVFEKDASLLAKLSSFYTKVQTGNDDFLSVILSTNEITVICSERLREKTLLHFAEKPRLIENKLAAVGLSFDEHYYKMPNVTYSLLRQIARTKIVLAETITTHTEIIFVFSQKHLADVVSLFQTDEA
jgi:hypothetical protein